jgi:type I restriction enzyme S subunit
MLPWPIYDLPSTIKKLKIGRDKQVPSTEIAGTGRFPVIDQGQSFIAGYHDDESKVIKENLPLIIFGDHTRCFKFVNFLFILGADGTKILKPDEKLFDAKFYYYALLGLDIPNRGYNRHFSLLKEKKIPRPELDEQRKIAAVLSLVQRAIEQQEQLIALTTELKKALMHKLFTEGLRGEPQKQTEIGPVPESWQILKLGSLSDKVSKGSSPRWQGFEYVEKGVLFVRSQNVGNGRMDFTDRAYLPSSFNKKEKRSVLKDEDVLINLVGASIGRVALGTPEIEGANCNQAVCFVRMNCDRSLKKFVVFFLLSPAGQKQMFYQKKDIARANLSLLDVESFEIPIPELNEAKEIAEVFTSVEDKISICERRKAILTSLFRTLLHQLMTAQIRVHDLDLSELEATLWAP